jgi:predicted nucleotidyltransferase
MIFSSDKHRVADSIRTRTKIDPIEERKENMSEISTDLHERAFNEFTQRAQELLGESLHRWILFGSTARGETHGRESDVDVFAVVETEAQEKSLLDLANEVGFEHGVFISVQTQTVARFKARKDHPFIQTVLEEGQAYV